MFFNAASGSASWSYYVFDLTLDTLVIATSSIINYIIIQRCSYNLFFLYYIVQKMIDNDPTYIIIIVKEKSSVKDCLHLRARDSSNYPGQHADDYAVFMPLCNANYPP